MAEHLGDPTLDEPKAILGASGAGKTVTAKHDVEQLLAQARHLAVIDPTGAWYGLRSDVAGTGPGFDIPIFGGRHGDVPIRPADGAAIAGIIVDQRVSAIVDLSAIDDSADWRVFMAAFVARLRAKQPGNFHLIVDEADEFAPQTPPDDVGFRLRENLVWMAKRGRLAGFVPTFITQRPADIAKAVLSQVQTIVAHQLVAPTDQKAIDDYIKTHGGAEVRKEVMASLAGLARGERWIYSPRLGILERGVTPPLTTFDSSATPRPGETRIEPRTLAQLDVTAIAAALAPAPDPGNAIPPDPAAAYRRGIEVGDALAERDRRIAVLEARVAEVDAAMELARRRYAVARADIAQALYTIAHAERVLAAGIDNSQPPKLQPGNAVSPTTESAGEGDADGDPRSPIIAGGQAEADSANSAAVDVSPASAAGTPTRGRKPLAALARIHPAGVTERQWALIAGYAPSGGTWGTYRNALRAAGHVERRGGLWFATATGLTAAGVDRAPLPPPGPELARFWADRIPGVRRMVDVLIKRWPHFITREALAADLGMAPAGGTFGTYLGRLRANALLEERAKRLRLAPAVMGDHQ